MSLIPTLRQAIASSSRPCRLAPSTAVRLLSTTARRDDLMSDIDKKLNPRELIERKRKEFEEKYGDKLKQRVEAEGVTDLEALKAKVMTPSVRQALKSKQAVKEYQKEQLRAAEKSAEELNATLDRKKVDKQTKQDKKQAQGDRSGIKPLGSIINLPLLHMTPHDADAISKIWTTYHSAHPTLSSSYLSASLPFSTYESMLEVAKANPFFVLPLPRTASAGDDVGSVLTDSYEMFYLQWLFHPTDASSVPPSADANPKPLPPTSSVIFTPLEEFKKAGEWAQPYVVLTHYPEMAHTHDLVLMRGEISPTTASGPNGSEENPGFLLSQQQAQLLALALQKFYCTGIEVKGEGQRGRDERLKRAEALKGFRERPQEWNWKNLVDMAYGGIV